MSDTDKIEAAVFRRLLQHLDSRKDVQNIELMNLAGFLRPGEGAGIRYAI